MCQVDFEPIGRRIHCAAGDTLLEAAQQAGVQIAAVCGGEGSCGRCRIRLMAGSLPAPNATEQAELGQDLEAGWRLACQARLTGDVRVHVPPDSLVATQRTQIEGQALAIPLHPAVHAYDVHLPSPSIHDLRSDAARVREALGMPDLAFDARVLQQLAADLRAGGMAASIWVRDSRGGPEVVAVRPAGSQPLGLAVDVGTTKLAAYLVRLTSGETLVSTGAMNPQIAFGEDVMARISYAMRHEDGAERLRADLAGALNDMARDLCRQARRDPEDVADVVVVGNTAMHHLFLGLSTHQLGLAPYVPTENAPLDIKARDAGLELAPGAYIYLPPNIAGFVGADHTAMLLATGMAGGDRVVVGLDIGTNTEVSLWARGRHLACSCASGPAFEGAHILHGMRAAPGAIERVSIHDGRLFIKTVDDAAPAGLCGSGILDLVAQLARAGVLDARGAMRPGSHPRVQQGPHGIEFLVVPGDENKGRAITFSRADVSEIQLAKAAIRAGVNILLARAGFLESEIDELIIAGAFGTYLDAQSGLDIGLFPAVERNRIRQVGNAAGAGARMLLLSTELRDQAARLARGIEYVELTAVSDFQSEFARALKLQSKG